MSIPSQAALTHLRSIKPNDGWSVKKDVGSDTGLRLLRRNVPLSDNAFLDIHYCPEQNVVVGVLTSDGSTCQVLVDEQGLPVTEVKVIPVSTYRPNSAASVNFAKSRSQASSASPASSTRRSSGHFTDPTGKIPTLTPEQNMELLRYALIVVGILMVANLLSSPLWIVAFPLLYLYGLQTCPSEESFDAKKELKRVLRGHHLPEDHPSKPKGFFEEMAARVTASVTAELATFPGYELRMISLGGAGWIADVRVPTAKTQCYWIGVFGKWRYVTSMEIPETHQD